ncbi:MAG: hypothetical protein ABIP48_18075 [Planctomycetota bacterium]
MNTIGPEVEPDCPVPVDVWAKVLDLTTKEPTGFVKRKRFRTYREAFRDLYRELDRIDCQKCGWSDYRKPGDYCNPCPECGEETVGFIDEYFSIGHDHPRGAEDQPIGQFWRIICYAVTGGNEGHYVHVEIVREKGLPGEQIDTLALGKTFRGWDHAWTMAKRCAELLGV